MRHFLKSLFLFLAVIIIIIGLFFTTRGCGLIRPHKFHFPTDIPINSTFGPILAEKDGRYVFYPGAGIWVDVEAGKSGWKKRLADAVVERIQSSLDSMITADGVSESEISAFVQETLDMELKGASADDYAAGKKRLFFDVTRFISKSTADSAKTSTNRMERRNKRVDTPLHKNY